MFCSVSSFFKKTPYYCKKMIIGCKGFQVSSIIIITDLGSAIESEQSYLAFCSFMVALLGFM